MINFQFDGGSYGYGFLKYNEFGFVNHYEFNTINATNNTNEFQGLILCLRHIKNNENYRLQNIHIQGDSQIIIKIANKINQPRKTHLIHLNSSAQYLIKEIKKNHINLKISYIPRKFNDAHYLTSKSAKFQDFEKLYSMQ
jgi:ribonuclease HI